MKPDWSCIAALMILVPFLGAVGCSATPKYTPTQMDALQTREVEAPLNRTFDAATNALLDAGYNMLLSDADAGLLTAEFRQDPAVAANVAVIVGSALLTLGRAPTDLPPTYHEISLHVLPLGPSRSTVRIRCFENAQAIDEAKTVEQIWTLMQRQVLMKEPVKVLP
jgi:hypothetical protein